MVVLKQLNYPISMSLIVFKSVDCVMNDCFNDPCLVVNFLIFTDIEQVVAKRCLTEKLLIINRN